MMAHFLIRSRPSELNQRKGQNEKFMNFALFCEVWCFSLRNERDSHRTLVQACPREKFMNWPFFLVWFAGVTPDLRTRKDKSGRMSPNRGTPPLRKKKKTVYRHSPASDNHNRNSREIVSLSSGHPRPYPCKDLCIRV